MVMLDKAGYILRKTKSKKNPRGKPTYRNWFFVRDKGKKTSLGYVCLGTLSLPKHLVGKKLRFKMELADDIGDV